MKIYSALFILIIFAACKKTPPIENIVINNNRDSLTYQPKEIGAEWTYVRNALGILTNYNFVRLTTDTVIGGYTYNKFNSDIDGLQFIRQDGSKYYSILTASTNKPSLLVLDTAKNINDSWMGGTNGNDTYTYTMKQKIPNYVLDGKTFKNVMVVHLERTTGATVTISGDTYYAQGVGQLRTVGTVSNIPVEIKLLSYK